MLNGKKVLIVEDETIVVEMLGRYLSAQESIKGIQIFFATNVEQCFELLEGVKPTLMILDLSLNGPPEHTGLKILKAYKDKLKIVVMSAYNDVDQYLKDGAFMSLTKPAKREKYLKVILDHA